MPIALPPLAEQTRIVAEVERRLSVIDALEAAVAANLARAGRLRQAMSLHVFDKPEVHSESASATRDILDQLRAAADNKRESGAIKVVITP